MIYIWNEMSYEEKCDLTWIHLGIGFSLDVESAFGALRLAENYSWSVHFDHNAENDRISGWAGDSNCHHRKPYDPEDGHGFSYVEEEVTINLYSAMFIAALRAVGVPIDSLTGTDWEGNGWGQCPYCGDLLFLERNEECTCVMRQL